MKVISLGKRLRACPGISCVGVQPNWEDYTGEIRSEILAADLVYYPSPLYEPVLLSLGKKVFPRAYYGFVGDKILQTQLFQLLEIPHPETRVYRGRNRSQRIMRDFPFPCVAKTPVGASQGRGVFLVGDEPALQEYLASHPVAYVQEYLPIDRDLRVVLMGGEVVHAYWRIQCPGDFRNNVSQGAEIRLEGVPPEALEFAREVARKCRFDEVGLDVCHAGGRYQVIEANMVYGLEGFRLAGLDLGKIFADLREKGFLP